MKRDIKQMITMKTSKFLTVAGACAGLALAGCATGGGTKTAREPLPDEEGKGGAAVTERRRVLGRAVVPPSVPATEWTAS